MPPPVAGSTPRPRLIRSRSQLSTASGSTSSGSLPLGGLRKHVRLEDVLSGKTCSPISLEEFENYLIYRERSEETLLFIAWFRSYRSRFAALSQSVRDGVPRPAPASGDPWTDSADVRTAWERSRGLLTEAVLSASTKARTDDLVSRMDLQQLEREAHQVVATFIQPQTPKELNLLSSTRERTLRDVQESIHPNVFLPAYEAAYLLLEQFSLAGFLHFASHNIGTPKRWFWLGVGVLNLTLATLAVVFLVVLAPDHPFKWKAARFACFPFAAYGAGCLYSAARGYCSMLERRGVRQLHAWEMEEAEEGNHHPYYLRLHFTTFSAHLFDNLVLDVKKDEKEKEAIVSTTPTPLCQTTDRPEFKISPPAFDNPHARSTTALISTSPSLMPPSPYQVSFQPPKWDELLTAARPPSYHSTAPPKRLPIFGPETLVVDPQVLAYHKRIRLEVFSFGGLCGLVSCGVALAL